MRLDEAQIRNLECRLNTPEFMGVQMGPAVSQCLVVHYFLRDVSSTCYRAADYRLRRWYRYWRPFFGRTPNESPLSGRCMVTWLANQQRLNQLIRPVLLEIGKSEAFVVCGAEDVRASIPEGVCAVTWRTETPFSVTTWRSAFQPCWRRWQTILREFARETRLPAAAVDHLAYHLLLQTQDVARSHALLATSQPRAVLTEYDRSSLGACLVGAARARGIPTFSLIHGVPGTSCLAFVPFVADTVFCWGEHDRTRFVEAGASESQLCIAGCPRLSRDLSMPPSEARAKMGLAPAQPVVLLATSPINVQDRLLLARHFCEAMRQIATHAAVIRLHPSETLQEYLVVARDYPKVLFLANSKWTVDEALAAATIVVVHSSGFGGDALVKRRPVVVLDVLPSSPEHGDDLVREAGCIRARSVEELIHAIRLLSEDEEAGRAHLANAERFVVRFCRYFGAEAARNIAFHILRGAAGGGPCPPPMRDRTA